MNWIIGFSAAAAIAASSGGAFAACATRDLAGDWQFYNTWWEDGLGLNWSRCLVSVDKTGVILSVTACADSDVPGEFDPPLWNGMLEITDDCVVTGFAEFGETGPDEEVSFDHATMTTRKNLIAGVGSDVEIPPTYWTFSMVEK